MLTSSLPPFLDTYSLSMSSSSTFYRLIDLSECPSWPHLHIYLYIIYISFNIYIWYTYKKYSREYRNFFSTDKICTYFSMKNQFVKGVQKLKKSYLRLWDSKMVIAILVLRVNVGTKQEMQKMIFMSPYKRPPYRPTHSLQLFIVSPPVDWDQSAATD